MHHSLVFKNKAMENGRYTATLYLSGLHQSADEAKIKTLFSKFGLVYGVKLFRKPNMPFQAGLVHFVRRESAESALMAMDDYN